ncbi:voltage-gated potassium channel [Hymenobacter daecheongensis DSM 21074]|uniref:Voltage-gated potassium channel n=1 Tax=Hymenobacter daecheongensis DSM 21074 TaxID=1121955 RepID=A0A1M6JN47_9BACT|nr:potassium channel protein [Hymenobacter daecheongensis]SHJ48147.1 voltage-gated potassium channel [Hymenobacter daecheongensis DSM 21074]
MTSHNNLLALWKRANLNRFVLALVLAGVSFGAGILGFMVIEDYSLLDAVYMTMITVSTVGFGELHPMSAAGRLFVSIYIFFNLLVIAYLVSVLTTYIFDGELRTIFKMFKSDHEIRGFSNHVIVCGFGRNGRKAYHELRANGARVVVIEQSPDLLRDEVDEDGSTIFAVFGDATTDETLRAAGVERARALITALPKDADNVFVALTARELNPSLKIIARASLKTSESKLLRAGADSVVMPDEIGGSHMANLVMRPEVIRFLEMINGLGPNKLRLEELSYRDLRSEWQGMSIRELDIRSRTGATVIGLKLNAGEFVVSPNADTRPGPGDILLVLGTDEQVKALVLQFKNMNPQYRNRG